MQCPPTRRRPNSAPTMVITSMPAVRIRAFVVVLRSYITTTQPIRNDSGTVITDRASTNTA
jgi:hypothetical protein